MADYQEADMGVGDKETSTTSKSSALVKSEENEPPLANKEDIKIWNAWAYEHAKLKCELTHPHKLNDELAWERYPICSTGEDEIGQNLGVGMGLYFDFLKFLSGICFIGFLLGSVNFFLAIQYYKEAYPEDEISLAPPGIFALATVGGRMNCESGACKGLTFISGACQLGFAVLIWKLIGSFTGRCSAIAAQTNSRTTTIQDYTLEMFGVPPYTEDGFLVDAIEKNMKAYFTKREAKLRKKKNKLAQMEADECKSFLEEEHWKVVQVSQSSDQSGLLKAGFNKAPLEIQVKQLTAQKERMEVAGRDRKVKSITKKLEKKEKKVQKYRDAINKKADKLPTLSAFVTFNTERGKMEALDLFNPRWWHRLTVGCFYGSAVLRMEENGKKFKLKAKDTEEPTSLTWENLAARGRMTTTLKRTLTLLLTILVLSISFIIVFATQELKNQADKTASLDCSGLNAEWDANYTMSYSTCNSTSLQLPAWDGEDKWRDDYEVALIRTHPLHPETGWDSEGPNFQKCQQCYCMSYFDYSAETSSGTSFLGDLVEEKLGSSTKECCSVSKMASDCAAIIAPALIGPAMKYGAAFIAVIVNVLLKKMVPWLASKELHASKTNLLISTATKLFLAQLLNTAIVIILVAAQLPGAINDVTCWGEHDNSTDTGEADLVGDIMSVSCVFGDKGIFFKGEHSDFNPDWFVDVAAAIHFTMLIQLAATNAPPFAAFIVYKLKVLLGRKKKVTMDSMEKLLTGPQFKLAKRMGETMSFMGIALILGPGVPTVYLLAAINFQLTYYVDKWATLRFYSNPPMYDEVLITKCVSFLKPMLVMHVGLAFWMYASIPSSLSFRSYVSDASGNSTGAVDAYDSFGAADKITSNASSLFLFLTMVMFILIMVIKALFGRAIGRITAVLSRIFAGGKVVPDGKNSAAEINDLSPPTFIMALEGGPHQGLRKVHKTVLSVDDVVRPGGFFDKLCRCFAKMNPIGILFMMFRLKSSSQRCTPEEFLSADPVNVKIQGPGKDSYDVSQNPFYKDAFIGGAGARPQTNAGGRPNTSGGNAIPPAVGGGT